MFSERNEKARADDQQLTASQKYGLIPQHEFMELEGRRIVQVLKGHDILKHAEAGDFVMSMRSFQGGLEYSAYTGSVSSAYVPLRPIKWACPGFFHYLFKSSAYIQELQSTSDLVRDGQALRFENFSKVPLPVVPMPEQEAIAAFLDRETARIDALIERKARFIELLREKRQALITHAVTKGLDASVPMKDSGVEWLGQVPAHWTVKAVKRITPVWRGASPRPIDDPKFFDDEGEYGWVRISDVSASDGRLRTTTQRLSDLGASFSVKLQPGALFLSIAATVGKPCITEINACIHDGFVYFPLLNLDARYLYRIFEAAQCFVGLGKLGTQLNLNSDTVGDIKIAIPPSAKVGAILSYLDKATTRIDTLIAKTERSIELLREKRTALITAAVTGKIDLREAA